MDFKSRSLLQQHSQAILKDLDVQYILDELFSKNAITPEDFDHIYNLKSRSDRVRYLIDALLQNGNNASYEAFVDSLSKDYHWLWEMLVLKNDNMPEDHDFEDSLSIGNVPRLPDNFVRRISVEQDVASRLKDLTRHKILVLHGMSGSGKTSVAISVLRTNPDLVTTSFNGVVLWLNFGSCNTDDDIVALQNKLYRKASTFYTHNSYMNSSISMSSIGSNADSQSLSSCDWTWEELRDRLKSQFSEKNLKDSLLVLDEVNKKKCVEAFDIGCKILITTRDTDVVANFHPQIIKIENNFIEKESLELFAKCLEVNVSELPRQAKKLHEACKGSPFNIALIGAQLAENRERLIHDPRRWNHYLNKLEKKEFFFSSRHNDNPMKTIEVCIKSLQDNILSLFKMLAILPDNAKVTSKVLSKLWNKDVTDVESIMKQLRSKSLIIEYYDHEQRNYIYEIHDLIMNYLKTCVSADEMRKLHEFFLKSYSYDNVDNIKVDIIDDGYIAFYIGFHILQTKNLNNKYALFGRLFLDLKFLGNKVRLTGPEDVIGDLQKYEHHIAPDDFDKKLLYNIKAYLSTHGTDLYRYPCTDIVQSILQHETEGVLYSRAIELAQRSCEKDELYFEFLHEQNVEEIKHSTIDVKENITAVCFLGDFIVIGTINGAIKVFHISTNKLKKELSSTSGIKWLGTCPVNSPIIASLTYDGILTIWYIDDAEQYESDDVIEEEPEESYNNNYASSIPINPRIGPYINCRWSNNDETLIAHTSKMIVFYNANGKEQKLIDNFERDQEIINCIPSNDDRFLIVAMSNGSVEVINALTKEKVMAIDDDEIALNILTVPGSNKIIILKDKEVIEHELFLNSGSRHTNCNNCRKNTVISSINIKHDLSFMSIAVNKSGTLLFVSTDDSRVICVDLKSNSHVFDLDNRRGNVISMAVSEVWYDFVPGSDVLLTGTGTTESTAKVWYLDASYVSQSTHKNGKVRLTTKFDVNFVNTLTPQTPGNLTPSSGPQSTSSTPKRVSSFVTQKDVQKKPAAKTMSLDRQALKPLNLKGICNGNVDAGAQPLLAVIDDKNNIQIIRGRKILTEILSKPNEQITNVKISPCNLYVIYGLKCGNIKKYTLRSKESRTIMDVHSPVQYMNFVNPYLLIVAGKNKRLMAYRLTNEGDWKAEMLLKGNMHLGSQEILNDIQGIKKKNGTSDHLSSSGSETSLSQRDRAFPTTESKGRLCKGSGLVDCFWLPNTGLVTVEYNATVKLWDQDLRQIVNVLYGRQTDLNISCAALKKNVLVICDDYSRKFLTFELKIGETSGLRLIQEFKLNNRIVSCDLTSDGNILAMGLDSGDVILWNVLGKRQLRLLKHHKSKVQYVAFSPLPLRLDRSNQSPHPPASPSAVGEGEKGDDLPLVLVTMAAEIVWWNVTYLMKMRVNKNMLRIGWNVITPLLSPIEPRSDLTSNMEGLSFSSSNFFFGDGGFNDQGCWKAIWKGKTYKEGSKHKEILSCIKLSGMTAKTLCHDGKFSCFVTVDNPGHIHIMNVMKNSIQ